MRPNRRTVAKLALALPAIGLISRAGFVQPISVPAADRENAPAKDFGFAPARFDDVEAKLFTTPTTALMVVASGRVVYSYGDIAQASYLASRARLLRNQDRTARQDAPRSHQRSIRRRQCRRHAGARDIALVRATATLG